MDFRELQALNAKEEKEAQEAKDKQQPAEEPAEESPELEPETQGEPEPEGEPTAESDDWMKAEEPEPDVVHTAYDAKAIRTKWKARAAEVEAVKNAEIEELKRQIEEIKKQPKPQQVLSDKPKRESFQSDIEYLEALQDYKLNLIQQQAQSSTAAEQRKQQADAIKDRTDKALDEHYIRVDALAKKSNINPETYQAAELRVRTEIDRIFPKGGDAVLDALIASMGAGSEKVVYNLGVNSARLTKFVETLNDDKSGIKAAIFLGKLNTELNAPTKRVTQAPDPIDNVQGDNSGGRGVAGQLKKKYDEAHKKGDTQKAFDIRRQARAQKIDTASW